MITGTRILALVNRYAIPYGLIYVDSTFYQSDEAGSLWTF